uniref:Putative secreted protein n=1 Tax=Ixodes ricinus TaxID=34613 RepID=A0A6B0UMG3_IXORI
MASKTSFRMASIILWALKTLGGPEPSSTRNSTSVSRPSNKKVRSSLWVFLACRDKGFAISTLSPAVRIGPDKVGSVQPSGPAQDQRTKDLNSKLYEHDLPRYRDRRNVQTTVVQTSK